MIHDPLFFSIHGPRQRPPHNFPVSLLNTIFSGGGGRGREHRQRIGGRKVRGKINCKRVAIFGLTLQIILI